MTAPSSAVSRVILIDGKNLCYRHGWSHRELHYDNVPTGMLYGTITGIARLARLNPGATMVVCWDGSGSHSSWRHKISPEYKANRRISKKPTKEEQKKAAWKAAMNKQIPLFKEFIDMMGFKQLEVASLEADDLIGILSHHLKPMVDQVMIYSTDRDFYQLMSKRVKVIRDQDKTKKCKPHRSKDVMKEFGVSPKDFLKYRAIVGDKGDHIIKVKGMGPKTALKMLAEGLDPSQPISSGMATNPGWDILKGDMTIEEANTIRLNYKLSKILIRPDAKQLESWETAQIKKFLRGIKCASDLNRERKKKGYKRLQKFLARYGFEELMARRQELWDMQ